LRVEGGGAGIGRRDQANLEPGRWHRVDAGRITGLAPGGIHNIGLMRQQLIGVQVSLGSVFFWGILVAIDRL
jgi:hypothetical protein